LTVGLSFRLSFRADIYAKVVENASSKGIGGRLMRVSLTSIQKEDEKHSSNIAQITYTKIPVGH